MKFKISNFFILVLLISISSSFVFAEFEGCINYTGGIGEFEIIAKSQSREIPKSSVWEIPEGWTVKKMDGIYFNFEIDRNNKVSGEGSFKINLEKPSGISISELFRIYHSFFVKSPDYISNETRQYYPDNNNIIKIIFDTKGDTNNTNVILRFLIEAFYTNNNSIRGEISTTTNISNWRRISYDFYLPSTSSILKNLNFIITLRTQNSATYSTGTVWIDNFKVFAIRNNNCILIPPPRRGSVNIFEVNHHVVCTDCSRNNDFVQVYLNSNAWTGPDMAMGLKVKNLDPNFKNLPYFLPTTLRKNRHDYFINNNTTTFYVRSNHTSVINQYFDEFIARDIRRFHPQARYPEFINKHFNYYTQWYAGHDLIRTKLSSKTGEVIAKNFYKYFKDFYNNSELKPAGLFFDVFELHAYYYDSPSRNEAVNKFLDYLRYFSKLNKNYILYIGNLGYGPALHQNGNFYFQKNFVHGYMDEEVTKPIYSIFNPRNFHNITLRSIFERKKDFDFIALVMQRFYPSSCREDDQQMRFLISASYIMNSLNEKTYFAFTAHDYSRAPQCYLPSMYLDLGRPYEINSISDIVVTSTPNFIQGGLYRSLYQKGIILLNTSTNTPYFYDLSLLRGVVNYRYYIDYFNRNNIDLENENNLIRIPPLSGLIFKAIEN